MSAQFMHAGAHDIICVEQTVHACSQAAHASIQACITVMSIGIAPGILIDESIIESIIRVSIPHPPYRFGRGQDRPPAAMLDAAAGPGKPPFRLSCMNASAAPTRSSRGVRLAVAALAALALLVPAVPASAHDQLISTDPAADAVLEALPPKITLTFSAELLADGGGNVVEVTDSAGTALADGPTVVDGTTVTQALAGEASGPVTVLWRVVSSDGHPISGEFAFTVEGAATPTAEPTETSASPEPTMTTMTTPEETTEPSASPAPADEASAPSPLPWIIGVVILLVVIGLVLYLLVIRPRGRRDDGSTGTGPTSAD
jgi:methionine-rich copper-binding protein CopC